MASNLKNEALIELGPAYTSFRDSGFDFPTAIGELIDNSLQAESKNIYIHLLGDGHKINRVIVIDDGIGMNAETLQKCPKLGFSSRYDNREGIGRFGVGATLAAISQCKRITYFSRQSALQPFLQTYIDLDEISTGQQDSIAPAQAIKKSSEIIEYLPEKSGTLVLWDKCDRIQEHTLGFYRSQLEEWIARAYRYFIYDGISISVNGGVPLRAIDPLYLHTDETDFPEDPPATVKFQHNLLVSVPSDPKQKSEVIITMTLLPEELRPYRGVGGASETKERHIDENEGISVLRHNREVAYGNFYPIVPASQEIDRWWGCEIKFEPVLDELWQIRNVKRGARPRKELRDKLERLIKKKVSDFRKEIRQYWDKVDAQKAEDEGIHVKAEEVVQKAEKRIRPHTPRDDNLSEDEKSERKKRAIRDPELGKNEQKQLAEKVEKKQLPISVKSKAMLGAEFVTTEHIGNGQIIVTFNKDHPFFSEIYAEIQEMEKFGSKSDINKALLIRNAIDLLMMAYGRAESMIDPSEEIDAVMTEFRTYWGVQLKKYIQELIRSS